MKVCISIEITKAKPHKVLDLCSQHKGHFDG
jgi:hypothetical protein